MSTHHYCTLFESTYLPRGLVMVRSLLRVDPAATVHVYCMDVITERVLRSLQLERVSVIGLRELEDYDPSLAAVRPLRTLGEYCWTATPSVCLHSLDHGGAAAGVTYLDADLEFYADPRPVFAERPDASILLTPHRYSPDQYAARRDHPTLTGVFNVQFVHFRNDANARPALTWWRERCLDWCYNRYEDGRFGDQRYLDDWPERFEGVHAVEHVGAGLAPWNARQFNLSARNDQLLVGSVQLIFYHYSALRLHAATLLGSAAALRGGSHGTVRGARWSNVRPLTPGEFQMLWVPYLERVLAWVDELRALGFSRDYWFSDDYRGLKRLRDGLGRRHDRRATAANRSRA